MNQHIHRETKFIDLGLIDYKKAWDYQTDLFNKILAVKTENRNLPESLQKPTDNYLLFCEHPHVFTLGRSGDEKNLLLKKEGLTSIQATYYHINRGGDITYHGPGQIVVYPVVDLENFFTDIHRYMRLLEESVIQTLIEFGIASGRIPDLTGVWLEPENRIRARKICALGVKTSRWVTLHGLAFNVNTDLTYFDYIVPCGIEDKMVTSLKKETGTVQDMNKVKEILKEKLLSLFEMSLVN
ncbi:MAG TPA: lipoyl(octanoyl) transferase LipB [Cyclobacteriaceae bacterium]|nr:lipoyl(octanoyl) transferase LipB [Cyclobacteriaceae bacterium]